jgi:GH24 family phage-related lysozyme (muramidase)
MTTTATYRTLALLLCAAAIPVFGQTAAAPASPQEIVAPQTAPQPVSTPQLAPVVEPAAQPVRPLLSFQPSDVKFDLNDLMDILRDRRHEGWVLTAYPDPKTGRPLIGAGFSLDLPEREHPQSDPLNPHPFVEPSSAQLWQAAGLAPQRLQSILGVYWQRADAWSRRTYMKRLRALPEQISDDEATQLLRIAAVQATYNARAYCRNFDQLTAPQQMAMSQLVYQMGVNLAEFDKFLSLLNDATATAPAQTQMQDAALVTSAAPDTAHWNAVQRALVDSQWARKYRSRAISVIAMLDPQYLDDPRTAELRIHAELPAPVVHHRRSRRRGASVRLASYTRTRHRGAPTRKSARSRHRTRS